ncbi:MAG: hypothetical protein OSA97_13435 [Nevskia sp.]|nr:hypothetical protein [Nevskia sp.]
MEAIFKIAGWGMGAHVVLSLLLLAILGDDPLADELFALPNAWLGPRPRVFGVRLLRAKYFLPWIAPPGSMTRQPLAVQGLFWMARLAGAAFPCLMVVFFVMSFVESVQS